MMYIPKRCILELMATEVEGEEGWGIVGDRWSEAGCVTWEAMDGDGGRSPSSSKSCTSCFVRFRTAKRE